MFLDVLACELLLWLLFVSSIQTYSSFLLIVFDFVFAAL